MSEGAAAGSRAAPPREFTDFLIELSVALHKHAIYPLDHPSLAPACETVARLAALLMGDRDLLAFGVARHQLIIDGNATDATHPVLRRLAESLHRHHLGAVSLLRGLRAGEVSAALHALAAEPGRDAPLELTGGLLPGVEHVRLHRLTFDGLRIVDDGQRADEDTAPSRSAELWIGLVRAALAGETGGGTGDGSPPGGEAESVDPSRVAEAIERQQGAEAYDQVVVGYLMQIATELKNAAGPEAETLRAQTTRLIGALRPDTLRRLMDMGGDGGRRHAFIADVSQAMPVEAVLDLVKAAADANGQTISHGLVRMLTKLSAHAQAGEVETRPEAANALREQVQSLLSEWTLADPNPDDYRQMLQYLATTASAAEADAGAVDDYKALRLVQMSLEVGTCGPLVERAIDTCLSEGGVKPLVAVLERSPQGSVAADRLRSRLTQPHAIGAIASREPLDEASLDYLMPSLSLEGCGVLLDVLASSRSRVTRRKLLDRLVKAPLDVAELVAARLEDDRWYVQRNMLVLLARIGHVPPGFDMGRWTTHADPRIRSEAVRLNLALPGQREAALRSGFNDADPRVVRVAVTAVQHECPPRVLPFLVGIAQGSRVPEDLRLLAVQALGHSRELAALEGLAAIVDGGRTVFGRQKLAGKTLVVLAALRALATAWRSHPRVQPLLAAASASADEDIRAAGR